MPCCPLSHWSTLVSTISFKAMFLFQDEEEVPPEAGKEQEEVVQKTDEAAQEQSKTEEKSKEEPQAEEKKSDEGSDKEEPQVRKLDFKQ